MNRQHAKSAIDNYINHYGRISKNDMHEWFGINDDERSFVSTYFRHFWENMSLFDLAGPFRSYSVSFPRIKSDWFDITWWMSKMRRENAA